MSAQEDVLHRRIAPDKASRQHDERTRLVITWNETDAAQPVTGAHPGRGKSLRNAALGRREFVERLGQLQRGALAHALRSADLTGATVSFSSMARWNVSRHIPVLPPHTSLIVAHAASRDGVGTLGATYDHRVLTGFDALAAIRALSTPEELT